MTITKAEVETLWPAEMRAAADAIREAISSGLAAMFSTFEAWADGALDQMDPTAAVGEYLVDLARERTIAPREDEDDEDLRDRVFQQQRVDARAIVDAVVAYYVAAGYDALVDDQQIRLVNLLDGAWWATDDADSIRSYLGSPPGLPDRAVTERLEFLPSGLIAWDAEDRSLFHLYVPPIDLTGDALTVITDGSATTAEATGSIGIWASDGSGSYEEEFWYTAEGDNTTLSFYQALAGMVQGMVGHGVRWGLHTSTTFGD